MRRQHSHNMWGEHSHNMWRQHRVTTCEDSTESQHV